MGSQYTDGINTHGISIKNRLLRKQLRNYFHIKYYGIIFSKWNRHRNNTLDHSHFHLSLITPYITANLASTQTHIWPFNLSLILLPSFQRTPPLLTHAFDLLTPRPRWLKYEEKVEAGERWSKPHVPTTALHALFEIRKSISDGTAQVLLDLDNSHGCIHQVAGWQCKHYELFKSILPEC